MGPPDWTKCKWEEPGLFFNDFYAPDKSSTNGGFNDTFHSFSRLPSEIRCEIWSLLLPPRRLVEIDVLADQYPSKHEKKNSLGNVISEFGWRLKRISINRPSVLMSVNQESRQLALSKYRIRFPLVSQPPVGSSNASELLYFCPETDVLSFKTDGRPLDLGYLLNDFKAYDPRGVGVLHLAIDASSMARALDNDMSYDSKIRFPHEETFSNLQSVNFRVELREDGDDYGDWSLPKYAPTPSREEAFDLVKVDPRLLQTSQEKVEFSEDPTDILVMWRMMEVVFAVERQVPMSRMHFMVTANQDDELHGRKFINTSRSAERAALWEYALWRSPSVQETIAKLSCVPGSESDTTDELSESELELDTISNEEELKDIRRVYENLPLLVAGFWIFPVNAVMSVGHEPGGDMGLLEPCGDLQKDLRPQLAVSRLAP